MATQADGPPGPARTTADGQRETTDPIRSRRPKAPDRLRVVVFDPSRPRTAAPRHLTPVEVTLTVPAVATVITSGDPLFALVNDLRTLAPEVRALIARYVETLRENAVEAR